MISILCIMCINVKRMRYNSVSFIIKLNILRSFTIYTNAYNHEMSLKRVIITDDNIPSLYINKNINYKNKKNYSLEHVVPRSFIHKKHHNDMHNIFKTLNHYNTLRSNYKFTDTNSKDYDDKDMNWQKTPDGTYYNFKKRMFIPLDDDKGIIARTILYMLYNYKYKTKKLIGDIDLIKWTSDYPPTYEEKYHNNIIKIHQYTDNIFISKYNKINYKNYIKYL